MFLSVKSIRSTSDVNCVVPLILVTKDKETSRSACDGRYFHKLTMVLV
jgi:hypothetical protein